MNQPEVIISAQDGRVEAAERPHLGTRKSGSPGRCLLLEPNPLHRAVLSRMLRNAGWDVEIADSAAELFDTAHQCDIVFIDCDFDEADGFAAASRIRDHSPSASPTIIALTSAVSQSDRKKRKAAGFDNYLQKPVRRENSTSCLPGMPQPPGLIRRHISPRSITRGSTNSCP